MSLVAAYDSSSDNEELEESKSSKQGNSGETKVNANPSTRQGLLSSLPPPKKVNGKVKIAMPSLPSNDSDNEEEPESTKPKYKYKAGSSLTEMLPAPKNAMFAKMKVIKSDTKSTGTEQSKQPMIPYTLTKKKNVRQNKPTPNEGKKFSGNLPEDEDNYDAGGFFGNLQDNQPDKTLQSTNMIQKNKLDSIDNSKHSNFSKSNYLNSAPDPSLEKFEAPTYQNQTPIAGVSCSPEYTQGSQYQYNDHGNYNVNSYNSTYENSSQSNSSESNFVNELKQDEQFLRMQGKRKRGDAEIINIIDVNEADHIADAAKFRQKFSTEELSYRPEDSGRLKPSQMQKRKHQITYLAFQAKERELELKNTWSANRATRRQTQSKYGF